MLVAGTTLGPYTILGPLGAGGMGEVYRAHDSRLGRDVAIKVLPGLFTDDPVRLARLEREARVVATLNHPHIAGIHGVEESAGVRGLILELVEGKTLEEHLRDAAGSVPPGIPPKEVLRIARQIADALDAAHEKGITHRDLKPANVKLTHDGVVKLLDFGIAKMVTGDEPGIDLTGAPTATLATAAGQIVGTPAYMSPEQARGKPVDRRTDIWAFGCVLYEMLTGRAAFDGETFTDVVATIVTRDPDWSALPAETPPALRRLVQRCLEKDPKQRLRDIGDARIEIEQMLTPPSGGAEETGPRPRASFARRRTIGVLVAAVVSLSAAILAMAWIRPQASPRDTRIVRFGVDLPRETVIVPTMNPSVALSPDGRFLATTPLFGPVYVRRLDGLEQVRLDSVRSEFDFRGAPLFSPDGEHVSFTESNGIIGKYRPFLKAALSGGAPTKLTDYDNFHSGDWSEDGWIYWTATYPGGIVRIRDSGGAHEPVTELDIAKGERSHRFARLLPGGDALVYTVGFEGIDSYDDARIDLWDLKTRTRKTLIAGGTAAQYSPSGHLVYARAGKLLAVPFDVRRREVVGTPFEVLGDVMMSRNTGAAHFSLSRRGDLAYVPGGVEGDARTLVWVDRSGREEPLPLKPASYLYPRIAPDGRSMAVEVEGPNHDLYFYDFARTVVSKVTTDGMSHSPVWSPDGRRVAYRSWQEGGMTMWAMNADRSGVPARLDTSRARRSPVAFSPDGRFLTFDQKDPDSDDDSWILPVDGGEPRPLAASKAGEGSAKFSPDGRWIAYSSDESGSAEIYAQAFPGPGPKIQLSKDGGTDPVWRRSGGELYYRSGTKMMVVSVETGDPGLRASAPRMLFHGPYYEGTGASCEMGGVSAANYDVTSDGQRFLLVRDATDTLAAVQVVVVLNWAEEVKAIERARAPGGRAN